MRLLPPLDVDHVRAGQSADCDRRATTADARPRSDHADDHGLTLEELRQEHLDAWLANGPSTRRFVDRFIPWAIKCRLVDPELTIAHHRRGTSPKLSASEQD